MLAYCRQWPRACARMPAMTERPSDSTQRRSSIIGPWALPTHPEAKYKGSGRRSPWVKYGGLEVCYALAALEWLDVRLATWRRFELPNFLLPLPLCYPVE